MQPAYVPSTYAEKKLGCVPNRIPMASTYGPFDLVPDVLVPWRNPYMGELMDYAAEADVLPRHAARHAVPAGRPRLVGRARRREAEAARGRDDRVAVRALLLELGGGVVVFRLALFPLMSGSTKFFERSRSGSASRRGSRRTACPSRSRPCGAASSACGTRSAAGCCTLVAPPRRRVHLGRHRDTAALEPRRVDVLVPPLRLPRGRLGAPAIRTLRAL